jgi:hypothetical protein
VLLVLHLGMGWRKLMLQHGQQRAWHQQQQQQRQQQQQQVHQALGVKLQRQLDLHLLGYVLVVLRRRLGVLS